MAQRKSKLQQEQEKRQRAAEKQLENMTGDDLSNLMSDLGPAEPPQQPPLPTTDDEEAPHMFKRQERRERPENDESDSPPASAQQGQSASSGTQVIEGGSTEDMSVAESLRMILMAIERLPRDIRNELVEDD